MNLRKAVCTFFAVFIAMAPSIVWGDDLRKDPHLVYNINVVARIDKQYKRDDKYVPGWGGELGKRRQDYEAGFNEGVVVAIDAMDDSSGFSTKAAMHKARKQRVEYQMGFFAALEVCSTIKNDVRESMAKPAAEEARATDSRK